LDRLLPVRDEVQPEEHGPQAVLLAHVARSRAEALLAAERDTSRFEQVEKVTPPRRRLVAGNSQTLRDAIDCSTRRHRACDAGEAVLIARYVGRICAAHRKAL